MKTEQEITQMIDEAYSNDGKFSGMTYEQGVVAALEWVMGEENPLED